MKSPRKPTPMEMAAAISWLNSRPSGDGEDEECRVVARWLLAQGEAAVMRKVAKDHNVPLPVLRKDMREHLTYYKGI